MPLHRHPGQDTQDLEAAVADVERTGGRVVQVVGQMAGHWWLLVDKAARKPAGQRETRSAAK
jgi:hypothetical protein